MTNAGRTAAVVLAAGSSSRFGSPKPLAPLGGRPMLQHVLDAVAGLGFGEAVVVLGRHAAEIEPALSWRSEIIVVNPNPEAGMSSSLRIGLDRLGGSADAAMIFLGDQPNVSAMAVARLLERFVSPAAPIVVPRYEGGGGANPVLVHRSAWGLALEAKGDRGLGPVLRQHPDLVAEVIVPGTNPDVDTPDDLAALDRSCDPPATAYEHPIRLASVSNLRDAGGQATIGGRRMKSGLLFRSAALDRLDEADAASLAAIGIRTVFDFRTAFERQQRPDRPVPGARHVDLDVLDGLERHTPAEIMALMDDPLRAFETLGDGKGKAMFMTQYQGFVELPGSRRAYGDLFRELAKREGRPALMHCTGGKDRTGWAAASLQLFLGVPHEAVMADYLATNDSFRPTMAGFNKEFAARGGDPAIIEAFMAALPEYLDAGLERIDTSFGSIEAYFSEGLGLDSGTLRALEDAFLE